MIKVNKNEYPTNEMMREMETLINDTNVNHLTIICDGVSYEVDDGGEITFKNGFVSITNKSKTQTQTIKTQFISGYTIQHNGEIKNLSQIWEDWFDEVKRISNQPTSIPSTFLKRDVDEERRREILILFNSSYNGLSSDIKNWSLGDKEDLKYTLKNTSTYEDLNSHMSDWMWSFFYPLEMLKDYYYEDVINGEMSSNSFRYVNDILLEFLNDDEREMLEMDTQKELDEMWEGFDE